MNVQHDREVHLREEELVQLLDREVSEEVRTGWDEHLASCLPCGERLGELQQASGWLHDHVSLLDEGVPVNELARARALAAVRTRAPRRSSASSSGWARAAAIGSVLVLGGLTVEPVRAWVFSGFGLVDAPEAPAPAAAAPVAAGATVSFLPTARDFVVELEHGQSAGSLTIRMVPGTGATAQVFDGREESLSVLPAALLVANTDASTAAYQVELPQAIVRRVRVLVAGRVVYERDVTGSSEPVVVDLARLTDR